MQHKLQLISTEESGYLSQYSDWDTPTGRSAFDSGQWQRCFLFPPVVGPTQPPTQWVPGIKRQRREAGHSSPTNAAAKNAWSYTSTIPYVFMAW